MRWIINTITLVALISVSREEKSYTPEERVVVNQIFGDFLNKSEFNIQMKPTTFIVTVNKPDFSLKPTANERLNDQRSCTTESDKEGICVHYSKCDDETKNKYARGNQVISLRTTSPKCPHYSHVCCEMDKVNTTTSSKVTKPTDPVKKIPSEARDNSECGFSNPGAHAFRVTDDGETAQYGEYPWMVALLRTQEMGSMWNFSDFLGGATLIHPSVVLTAAHKVFDREPQDITCRVGEWDLLVPEEYQHQDRTVRKIVTHLDFYKRLSINNVAVLFVDTPFTVNLATPHIAIACLGRTMPAAGTLCQSMGWGKNKFDEETYGVNVLKKVILPIVDKTSCENSYRQVPDLGSDFELDSGFVCAGGSKGKDTCIGDGGSPLVCHIGDPKQHRFAVFGIVAWGIGCGEEGRPGVYMNVPEYRTWITDQMKAEGIDGAAAFDYKEQ